MRGRFSSPVMPGDQLDVKIWVEQGGADNGNHTAYFQTLVGDQVVLDNGYLEFSD